VRVVTINYADHHGGAERVALTLHRALRKAGHDCTMLVGWKAGDDPDVVALSRAPNRQPRALAARAAWKLGYQGNVGYPRSDHLERFIGDRWDLMLVHGLPGNFLDFRQLPQLSAVAPTVLILHDMMPFTGHCGYTLSCERFTQGCGHCPDLKRGPTVWIDRTSKALAYKERTIGASSLVVSAPCQWMLNEASRSYLGRFPMRHINYPLDTGVFAPDDRADARRALGLPPDASILLLPAANRRGRNYKGLDMVRQAMGMIDRPDLLLVTFGQPPAESPPTAREHFAAPVRDQARMAQYYAAADIVVYPSTAENSPLAVIEGMACGRPVVATSVGGVPELFTDGTEGLLVTLGDATALARQLEELLHHPDRREEMGRAGVARADRNHSLPVVLGQWTQLYEELAARNGH
jgi:glycosyltransferase involved in cell wall biosynthesis